LDVDVDTVKHETGNSVRHQRPLDRYRVNHIKKKKPLVVFDQRLLNCIYK